MAAADFLGSCRNPKFPDFLGRCRNPKFPREQNKQERRQKKSVCTIVEERKTNIRGRQKEKEKKKDGQEAWFS